ncbi:MAG: bacterial Ig-like domain-containing protein, partial [Clostridia bacterium]|nr:bacterial Ig-like domain-containing protein [Clostridia bacterium]
MEQLLCDDNQLSALDLSNKTVLRVLWCGQNKLTTLDLSDCAALYYLTCGENQLSSLDASACPELYTLSCGDNQLTALNLTGSPKLFDLYCSDNRLTELDVSKNVALHRLICEQNYLTELDVSACSELYELNCNDNLLTKLDVSKISSLHTLFCHRNKLPEMDISGLSSISTFSGVDQKVEAIAMKDGDKYILDMHDVVSDTSKLGYTVWYSDYDENTCVFSITGADGQKSERVYKYFVDDENKNFIRVNLSITLKDPPTLTGISITTAPTKTAYTVGEIFDPAGMVVTATYSDNSSKVLTEDEYTYAPSTALTADVSSITVSYKDDATKTATQTITVSAAPATYTVTYDANGGTGTMADGTATEGVAFSLPANDFTAPANKQFKAWQIGSAEYQPGDTYTFTANITVKAVWEDIPATAPDYEGAKDAINEQVWAVAQAVANSAEQLKPWIEEELESILNNRRKIQNIIIDELKQIVKKYPSPRKTGIVYSDEREEYTEELQVEDYPVTLFLSREGYFKKITAQSLRMSSEQKYKEGDSLFQSFESNNRSELLFLTDKQQMYKARVSDFEDTKASVLGAYLPTKLQFDEGENVIAMISPGDYSKHLLLVFENGKAARIEMASYETKTNRKKLINACSDKSPVKAVMVINEEMDVACFASDDRV